MGRSSQGVAGQGDVAACDVPNVMMLCGIAMVCFLGKLYDKIAFKTIEFCGKLRMSLCNIHSIMTLLKTT